MTSTYVTVAIPYVNANPHLGYAYELVQADVFARSARRAGHDVRFLGGTDDYSLKNVLAAEAAGVPTRRFVDDHARRFQALAQPLGLSFDDFIRTSADPRHVPAVERLWQAAFDAGDLYRRHYEGDYCVGCEQFYDPADQIDGCCPEHLTPTERVAEENWFFRLSAYQDQIDTLIGSDRLAVRPEPFRREVLAFVRAGLRDISVSRSVDRARGWGIPVPGDDSQVIYVWFDALANYVSALEFGDLDSPAYRRWWLGSDERIHVIGKGVVRFHAVYWPAFLAAAGQPAPTRIQVHPYLTIDGQKLSKSRGTTIDPTAVADRYGTDALRWFFARDVHEVADTDVTAERLVDRANQDLAHALGNVTNRIVTLVHRYCDGQVPAGDHQPLAAAEALAGTVRDAIADFQLRGATRIVIDAATSLNRDLEATRPWAIAKDPTRTDELHAALGQHIATARAIATAAEPIVPSLAQRLRHQLGDDTARLPEPTPAFQRLEPVHEVRSSSAGSTPSNRVAGIRRLCGS
jgi:methionyl-tRNA synthetase